MNAANNAQLRFCTYNSALVGALTLVSNGNALIACHFETTAVDLAPASEAEAPCDDAVLKQARMWLDRYFDKQEPSTAELPLEFLGTPFQQRVWKLLLDIPYGKLATYGEIAQRLSHDKPTSSRAVGGAVGRNPLGIIVPCHRVMGANGNLTGFTGGIETKIALLQHEGHARVTRPTQRSRQ